MDRFYFIVLLIIFSMVLFNFIIFKSSGYYGRDISVTKVDIGDINMFYNYRKKFNKTYGAEEFDIRFRNFKESLIEISILNEKEPHRIFKLTKFSDMAKEEFASQMLTKMPQLDSSKYKSCGKNLNPRLGYKTCHLNVTDRPAKFDWRTRGVVSDVLDQKLCQVCYAFGTAGVMESVSAIRQNRTAIDLSKQELIDCTKSYSYSSGCKGGSIFKALLFLCNEFRDIGLLTEDQYPLTLIDGACGIPPPPVRAIKLKEFLICEDIKEDFLPGLIWKYGPALAVVNAYSWIHYTDGIIERACDKPKDFSHVIQIVGYNLEDPIPYYIIRNSWGTDFGEDGYVRVKIGDNLCGIAHEVGFVDAY